MGTWGTGILSNDYSSDIYDEFFSLYNQGSSVKEISDFLIKDNHKIIIDPKSDSSEFWLALALAQWECKALEKSVFETVKKIVDSGENLAYLKQSDASLTFLKKREKLLNDFLQKLSTERKTAKKRKKEVLYDSIFRKGDCLTYVMNNGNYGGALVLTDEKQSSGGANFIAVTTINQAEKPTIRDFKSSEIYIMKLSSTYYLGDKWIEEEPLIAQFCASQFKQENIEIEVIGNLKIYRPYKSANFYRGYGWGQLLEILLKRDELELKFGKPKMKIKSSRWTKLFWI